MAKSRSIFYFAWLCLVLAGGFLIFVPSRAEAAASLYVSPTTGTFSVGSTFTVSILVNTGGQYINAVEANLRFPPDKLQVVSPTAGKSFIQIWVSQPTYSNSEGTMKFQGTVPTPGIQTEAGLISTVTFRVKSIGTAVLKITDGSKVLLNDGRGTDILGQTTDGIYYLVLPPPAGPTVTSRTNPDQEKWYNTKSVVFEWSAAADIQGYSYILNENPIDEPDDISEGVKTRVVYNNLADGTYYFHIKSLRQGAWGGTTDYIVKIDNTPPAAFKINFSPGSYTSNPRPIIDFTTTDVTSGIEHYELKIIPLDLPLAQTEQANTPFFIETSPPYSRNLGEGRYQVAIRAYDYAGNYYQSENKLTIVKLLFEFLNSDGLRVAGFTIGWPYVCVIGIILLALLVYLARFAWRLHRRVEKQLEAGALKHPAIALKLEELKAKQSEYGGKKGIAAALIILALSLSFLSLKTAFAELSSTTTAITESNVSVEPPVVTLFPSSISNDEILYIGGRAGAPQAKVLIYIQRLETGSTISATAVTDKNGAWFYSFPQFLETGHYVVWTQLKVGESISPPSSKSELSVAPTAIQIGGSRLNYQDFYFILFLIFAAAFFGLLIYSIYHVYHFRVKSRRLNQEIKEAEESIRRGFSVLRRDIEAELGIVRKLKLSKELSFEEKLREEKLLKDLDFVSRYITKEVWDIEEAKK